MVQPLPDLVPEGARVVFCGRAGVGSPRPREHYYATPGNSFWELLHASGLVPRRLGPDQDAELPGLGLGLTDVVGSGSGAERSYDVPDLLRKLRRWQPEWLALTSKATAQVVARHLGERPPGLGPTSWEVEGCAVFVLPGTSGANRRVDYDGRPDRLSWWRDLAAISGP